MSVRALILLCAALFAGTAHAATTALPKDPLHSGQWPTMARLFLGEQVVFDQRVRLLAPPEAEDSMNFPVLVDASQLAAEAGPIEEIVVFADYNPIPLVLKFQPGRAAPRLGFRLKLQQGTPIRAGARTADGVWHVGHIEVDAAGGGCTVPSLAHGNADWSSRLGEISGGLFEREQGARLRFRVMHPMDTGLADGIPVFRIEHIELSDADGALARIEPYEPVSENPLFSLDLPSSSAISLAGRDNNANRFSAEIHP